MKIIILLIIFILEIFPQTGSGTSGDPYIITTPAEFDNIRNLGLFSTNGTRYFELANNIDFNGYGDFSEFPILQSGAGISIEGNGYTVSNLTLVGTSGENNHFALFQWITTAGDFIIKNIILDGWNLTKTQAGFSNSNIGLIVGLFHDADVDIEGIIIRNCIIDLEETSGGSASTQDIGFFASDISSLDNGSIRNITVESCSLVYVSNRDASKTGGLIAGSISNLTSFSIEEIVSRNNYISVTSLGNPSNGARAYAGGIIGRHSGGSVSISNFYSLNNEILSSLGSSVASVSAGGWIAETSVSGSAVLTLDKGYAAQNIVNSTSAAEGSLIGRLPGFGATITITNSYVEDNPLNHIGSGTEVNLTDNSEDKTESQMKDEATYIGWDFTNIWNISESTQDNYPYLIGNVFLILFTPIASDVYVSPEVTNISWVGTAGSNPEVDVYYSLNGGTNYTFLATSISPYEWDFSSISSTLARIKIDFQGFEVESGIFSIYGGRTIKIDSPLVINSLFVGSNMVTKIISSFVDSFKVEVSYDSSNWLTVCDVMQADENGLDTIECIWSIPENARTPLWVRAIELTDTALYTFDQPLSLVGTTMPTHPQICWHSHEDRPVQSYLSYDQSCGWVSGLNHTLVITEIVDDGTYSRTFITCDVDCEDEAGENIDMTFVTVGAQQYTINQFYTFGQSVTYKGRKYYTGSETLWMDDLINDIDSIFVADLSPYINITKGGFSLQQGWTGTPSLLQLYHVQKGKIRGNTYLPDQVFEDLNDSWFKPMILIAGGYYGHGGLLVYKIDALPTPPIATEANAVEDVVKYGLLLGDIPIYRNYFRGIHPKIRKD